MPASLGDSGPIEAVASQNNLYVPGAYVVTMGPQQMGVSNGVGAFECYHIAIKGPVGSNFQVYVGNKFYDYVDRGDINSWDPANTMKLISGNTVYFYWSAKPPAAPVPVVTMYFQEATPL